MMTLSCGALVIPMPFVQSVSYGVTARTSKNSAGFVRSRGREAVECSVQITVSRAVCDAIGEQYGAWRDHFLDLTINRHDASDFLTVAGFVVYPQMLFALTAVHWSVGHDRADAGAESFGMSLTLSACDVASALPPGATFEDFPEVTVRGMRIDRPFTRLVVGQMSVDAEIDIGDDFKDGDRPGWMGALDNGGEIAVGEDMFTIYAAEYDDSYLRIRASIFTRDMMTSDVKTYTDTTLEEILRDMYPRIAYHVPRVGIAHWTRDGIPVPEAIEELQNNFGFLVALRDGVMHIYMVHDITPSRAVPFDSFDLDERSEAPAGIYWTDGILSSSEDADGGAAIQVASSARVSAQADADAARRMRMAYARLMSMEMHGTRQIDAGIRAGAMIGVQRGLDVQPVVVADTVTDYIEETQTSVMYGGAE